MEINLLPWRDEMVAYNKKFFFRLIIIALVLSGFFLIITYHLFFSEVAYTSSYTQALEEAKTNLVNNIKDYLKFKKENEEILTRINTLKRLENKRFQTIQVLNAIAQLTPKGVYLTKISRKDSTLDLTGIANSNLLITQFMKGIEKSSDLQIVSLRKVEKTDNKELLLTQFDLSLSIKSSAPALSIDKTTDLESGIGAIKTVKNLQEHTANIEKAITKQGE